MKSSVSDGHPPLNMYRYAIPATVMVTVHTRQGLYMHQYSRGSTYKKLYLRSAYSLKELLMPWLHL